MDTLVHLSIIATPTRVGGRSAMKEINVIGSLQLFAAARRLADAPQGGHEVHHGRLRREPAGPGGVHRGHGRHASVPRTGTRRTPSRSSRPRATSAAAVPTSPSTILRFANFMGSQIETPLTRYFSLPVVPTALGYDPRIQLVHEDDAVEVARTGPSREDHPGHLQRGRRRRAAAVAGRPAAAGRSPLPVPLPLVIAAAGLVRRSGRVDFPADQVPLLIYGRVADTERLRAGVRLHAGVFDRGRPWRSSSGGTGAPAARDPAQRAAVGTRRAARSCGMERALGEGGGGVMAPSVMALVGPARRAAASSPPTQARPLCGATTKSGSRAATRRGRTGSARRTSLRRRSRPRRAVRRRGRSSRCWTSSVAG